MTEPSLRETKRRATRASIEDHATALVADRGMDAVTVEDICAKVGISRRTFFNYVDSKETAVLGDAPQPPDEEARERFLGADHPDLVAATIALGVAMTSPTLLPDAENRASILRRRRQIRHDYPEIILQRNASFHHVHHVVMELVSTYLERHPESRRLPKLPTEHEALSVVGLAATAIQLGYLNWLQGQDPSIECFESACTDALHHFQTLVEPANDIEE